jgi:hypothetical protein
VLYYGISVRDGIIKMVADYMKPKLLPNGECGPCEPSLRRMLFVKDLVDLLAVKHLMVPSKVRAVVDPISLKADPVASGAGGYSQNESSRLLRRLTAPHYDKQTSLVASAAKQSRAVPAMLLKMRLHFPALRP